MPWLLALCCIWGGGVWAGGGGWEEGKSRGSAAVPVASMASSWHSLSSCHELGCQSESLGKMAEDQNEGQLANS